MTTDFMGRTRKAYCFGSCIGEGIFFITEHPVYGKAFKTLIQMHF